MPSIVERLFGRRGERPETRTLTPLQAWLADYYPDSGNPSGERVTQENATTLATVFACQTLISDMVSSLPVDVMRDGGGYPVEVEPEPAWLESPVPNDPTITRAVHFGQVVMSLVSDGSAFVHVAPHVVSPEVLTVVDPRDVTVTHDGGLRPKYRVVRNNKVEEFTADNMLHIPRTMRPGADRGLSPIDEARITLGTYMAATKHAGRFYRNGALLATIIEVPGEMSETDAKALRDAFDQAHTGDNVFKTGVLSGGAKATTLGVTPEQAQFLDTLKHGTVEVCRIFRVPPMLVGVNEPGAVSYASAVEAVKAFARNTLAPILRPIELAYGRLLGDGEYLRFDMNGLLRADPEARYAGYAIGVEKGFLNRDEIRAWEELPPIGGKAGKLFTVQAQMTDLETVAEPPPPPPQLAPFAGQNNPPKEANPPEDPTAAAEEPRYAPGQPRDPKGRFGTGGGVREFGSVAQGREWAEGAFPSTSRWGQAQYDAARDYVNGGAAGYANINGWARGERPPYIKPKAVDPLDRLTRSNHVPETVLAHRSVGLDAFEGGRDGISNLTGKTISDGGFLSTNLGPGGAVGMGRRPVEMNITVPAGSPGVYIGWKGVSKYRDKEAELLLPRNTKLQITGVRRVGAKWEVDALVVE